MSKKGRIHALNSERLGENDTRVIADSMKINISFLEEKTSITTFLHLILKLRNK